MSTLNATSKSLLTLARALSVDEMMVKSYGMSVLLQYNPLNQTCMPSNRRPYDAAIGISEM